MNRRASVCFAVAVASLAMTTCGKSRPSVTAWREQWRAVRDELPHGAQFATATSASKLCGHALGVLRRDEGRLLPTPNEAVDDLVELWRDFAAELYYECPPKSGTHTGFDAALAHLGDLEAEIERLLE